MKKFRGVALEDKIQISKKTKICFFFVVVVVYLMLVIDFMDKNKKKD